jgi:hypothetical protein
MVWLESSRTASGNRGVRRPSLHERRWTQIECLRGELLTRHLKGEDFFDVARYPRAEFVSEAVGLGSDPGLYQVAGQLQFHGV